MTLYSHSSEIAHFHMRAFHFLRAVQQRPLIHGIAQLVYGNHHPKLTSVSMHEAASRSEYIFMCFALGYFRVVVMYLIVPHNQSIFIIFFSLHFHCEPLNEAFLSLNIPLYLI